MNTKFRNICLALIIVVIGGLACLCGILAVASPSSTAESIAEPAATVVVVPTLEPTVMPPSTPAPLPTTIPIDLVQVYSDSIMEIVADWSTGYSQFSELFTAAGNDIGLMDDPSWLSSVYGTMELMTAANARLRTLVPPEQFVPSHQALLEAATHTDTAISLLRTGIATKDIPTIVAATEQIRLGTEDIERATALLDEITL